MGDDAAPTELAGIAQADTEMAYAWALDYDDEPTVRFTARRITATALGGSLVLIAAAGVMALLVIRGVLHIEQAPEPAVVATPPVTTTAPQPSATVVHPTPGPWLTPTKPVTVTKPAETVTVAAPAPVPTAAPRTGFTAEQIAVWDRQFVANIQAAGWQIWDPVLVTQRAHQVCYDLQSGVSREEEAARVLNVADPGTMTAATARQFTLIATATYPSCPP